MSPNLRSGSELPTGEDMQQQQPSVSKGPYRGDVSALCLTSRRRLLLAGTGAQVLLYDLITGLLLSSRNVFDGVRVHGIYSGPAFGKGKDSLASQLAFKTFTIVIHGERRIKMFKMVWHLEEETPQLHSLGSLPRFSHWVMDVRILKEEETTLESAIAADAKDLHLLAVGLSNNTMCIWDLLNSAFIYRVECSERCLLYSMRLWGSSLETLHAGAGTIFNEVIVWKLGSNLSAVRNLSNVFSESAHSGNPKEHGQGENIAQDVLGDTSTELVVVENGVHPLQRLVGHEGSIHRLTWSSDGLSLVSVSDDRSARVWCASKSTTGDDPWLEGVVAGTVLYGHGSRLWDCYVGEELLITASEDCTCRVWTAAEGRHLATLKGHIGRGIWRCVYDPEWNSLITAGADSSIKVQSLNKWVSRASSCETDQDIDPSMQRLESQSFRISPPWLNSTNEGPSGFMDSKSEYVRCVALSSPWSLYVSTNQGAIYNVYLGTSSKTSWTVLSDDLEGPIVCMDVLAQGLVRDGSSGLDDTTNVDTIVVGTGRGIVSVVQVRRRAEQWLCEWRYSWVAEKERQLLGVYFCKSLGGRYVFTTDPRGTWRMWQISDRKCRDDRSRDNHSIVSSCSNLTNCRNDKEESYQFSADLIAFGRGSQARVLCIDVCPEMQLLVCGDKRGDLEAFSLPKGLCEGTVDVEKLVMNTETEAILESPVVAVFKGAHGISAIASVSVLPFQHGQQAEIISTGSDGCICRFLLDQSSTAAMPRACQQLSCTGIEKVAALSIVESLEDCKGTTAQKHLERWRIAAGFTSSDFLLWDLTHQCEVMRVICGGWRRPHSVLVGRDPELQYCFVFVKDQVLQIQRTWTPAVRSDRVAAPEKSIFSNIAPKKSIQSLRGQFHGKEISSVLFLYSANDSLCQEWSNPISWIASGSEDGTVVLSRYTEDTGEQLDPTAVLGDHVGGSAVRALAFVAEIHRVSTGEVENSAADSKGKKAPLLENIAGSFGDGGLLFSAGAKEVLTCWLLQWLPEVKGDELSQDFCGSVAEVSTASVQDALSPRRRAPSSQWLSTHIPKSAHPVTKMATEEEKKSALVGEIDDKEQFLSTEEKHSEYRQPEESSISLPDDADDDQRYLALSVFGTRCAKTGALVSFVATASSNATLHLFAFHVTHRSWIELAVLEHETALVLAIEHFIAPFSSYGLGDRDVYIIVTGAANGNIALWDVTNVVHAYCNFDGLNINSTHVAPMRPLTGRGSQGGRRRKKIAEQLSSASLGSKNNREKSVERETELDAVVPTLDEDKTPYEENARPSLAPEANELPKTPLSQPSKWPSQIQKPFLRLNPIHEVIAAHQSGINCMTVARIQSVEHSAFVYVVISGGDDQALHMATFTLSVDHSGDSRSAQRSNAESSTSTPTPPVLQYLSQSSVPCAHNSSVKGVWTDGLWAFSTGLDQRLRCWRIDRDAACSQLQPDSCKGDESRHPTAASPLVECVTCVIDVPEPASLHVQHRPGGLYQIAVVGRGLQVIKFDSSSLSCQ
ncbi:unnamed protein product [Calypogeia fissa]